jgi:hypothetical protein
MRKFVIKMTNTITVKTNQRNLTFISAIGSLVQSLDKIGHSLSSSEMSLLLLCSFYFFFCYSKICPTIAILHRGPFSISLCRLVIPFDESRAKNTHFSTYTRPICYTACVYAGFSTTYHVYIGICARKYKNGVGFHVTTRDI